MRQLFLLICLICLVCLAAAPSTGLALLALLHPNFPVSDSIELLKKAPDPSFSFQYGTFGKSPKNFNRVVKAVPKSEVAIYVLCGPCRIPRRNGSMEIFHRELTINALNKKLVSSPGLRNDYRKVVLSIKKNFVDTHPYTHFVIYPELESNFDSVATGTALNILLSIFRDTSNVSIRVNPRTYQRINRNIPVEVHSLSLIQKLRSGDSVSMDGLTNLSEAEIKSAIRSAKSRGATFYLWFPEWQGVTSDPNLSPNKRHYRIENKSEVVRLLNS